jgi:HemY protein
MRATPWPKARSPKPRATRPRPIGWSPHWCPPPPWPHGWPSPTTSPRSRPTSSRPPGPPIRIPDLAAAFAEIAPNETPAARLKRFQPLIAKHPGHPEAKLLEAELQIAKEDFPAARRALGDLAETKPTARSLTIMAAIERGEGSSDRIVQAWLARAVTASRGPQWICGNCGHVHAEWRPVCANCESFDTLSWEEAPQSAAALAGPAQMLPLIVGALENRSAPDVEDADTVEDAATDEPQPDMQADRGDDEPAQAETVR